MDAVKQVQATEATDSAILQAAAVIARTTQTAVGGELYFVRGLK